MHGEEGGVREGLGHYHQTGNIEEGGRRKDMRTVTVVLLNLRCLCDIQMEMSNNSVHLTLTLWEDSGYKSLVYELWLKT